LVVREQKDLRVRQVRQDRLVRQDLQVQTEQVEQVEMVHLLVRAFRDPVDLTEDKAALVVLERKEELAEQAGQVALEELH
jgi:hypothetical protein